MDTFIPESLMIGKNRELSPVPLCGQCKLHKNCKQKMAPALGPEPVLFVGEFPGERDDQSNKYWTGEAGRVFKAALSFYDFNDFNYVNALACYPGKVTPAKINADSCMPKLLQHVRDIKPKVIVAMGELALQGLLGHYWPMKNSGMLDRFVGWQIPCHDLGAWVCPTYSPRWILKQKKDYGALANKLFNSHIEKAIGLLDLPGGMPSKPDYQAQVDIVWDPNDVVRILKKMIARGGDISFDIETNMTKPEHPSSEILCAAVCYEGKKTISFNWNDKVKEVFRELMLAPNKKIGANIKFEQRWLCNFLDIPEIVNWIGDVCLFAHLIDNRPDITSVKFQAFIELGVAPYNDQIKQFMESDEETDINELRENVDPETLLLYCGEDALYEYILGKRQLEKLCLPV